MPELRLSGCRTRPLLGYLKAMGLLRVVSRQADPSIRSRWSGGVFELASSLEAAELERFLLERYQPAPIVSPWNGGSGFFAKDDTEAIATIEADMSARFAPFREAIAVARSALAGLGIATKPDPKTEKPRLLRLLRASLPDAALEWLDATVVLLGDEPRFPPLLGSGGNDGRYDFANNYARAVLRALAGDETASNWLDAALHGRPAPLVSKLSLAHLSRDSSPVNSPQGEADALGNPWDLVLALEGSLLFAASAARRHGTSQTGALVAPFTVLLTAAGYGSAITGERGRAELWLPVWSGWASLAEIELVVREGRAQIGRRQARDGYDLARATGELGVARGIDLFERYAILERAGQSSLSVPVGRIEVQPKPGIAALRSLDPWVRTLDGYRRGGSPAALEETARQLELALFHFAESGLPAAACRVLEALGAVESTLASAGRRAEEAGLRPPSRISAGPWLEAANDGSLEFAAATAIASLRDDPPQSSPAVRDYLNGTGLDDRGRRTYAGKTRMPRRGSAAARLAALHARRHVDVARDPRLNPRRPSFGRGTSVPIPLLSAVALGEVDLEWTIRLATGLSLLDFRGTQRHLQLPTNEYVDPTVGFLVLAWSGTSEVELTARPDWPARLASGHVEAVVAEAALRLRLAELPPLIEPSDFAVALPDGALLTAALLLRTREDDRSRLAPSYLAARQPTTEGALT